MVPRKIPGARHADGGVGESVGPAGVIVKHPVAHKAWRSRENMFGWFLPSFSSGVQAEDCMNRVFWCIKIITKPEGARVLCAANLSVDGGNSSSPCMSSCKWKIGAGCKPLYKILEKHMEIRAARPTCDYRI